MHTPRDRPPMRLQSDTRTAVIAAALGLVAAYTAFRAWALYGSWFYTDDYRLLFDATTSALDWEYLSRPFDSQFMPVGRLIAWVVAATGPLNWTLAATITLLLQAVAGVACVWMLVTLFGARWGILPPLVLYLFTAITVPAMMWWAASLNQVMLQIVMFAAVGTWILYLRGRRKIHLALTLALVAVGLLTYVKTVLIIGVLAFIALAYFAEGSVLNRLSQVVRRYWAATLLAVLLAATYALYYVAAVPQPFDQPSSGDAPQLLDSMLGTAFPVAAVGGPWHWRDHHLPTSLADPPAWSVHASWVVATLVIVYAWITRSRSLRAWALLGAYLLALYGLVVTSRATVVGGTIGLEYRYLTDAAAVLALAVGLAFLPVAGSTESSATREPALLLLRISPGWVTGLVIAVAVGGIYSSYDYVDRWHSSHPGDRYVHTTLAAFQARSGPIDLADTTVPDEVVPAFFFPYNQMSRMVRVLGVPAAFPDVTSDLAVVADDGTLRRALVEPRVTSRPGPVEDCGWPVRQEGAIVPLTGSTVDWDWWIRIGYLASEESPVTIVAGPVRKETTLQPGPNSLYLRARGSFDDVLVTGLDRDTTVCVDVVEAGPVAPGGAL